MMHIILLLKKHLHNLRRPKQAKKTKVLLEIVETENFKLQVFDGQSLANVGNFHLITVVKAAL